MLDPPVNPKQPIPRCASSFPAQDQLARPAPVYPPASSASPSDAIATASGSVKRSPCNCPPLQVAMACARWSSSVRSVKEIGATGVLGKCQVRQSSETVSFTRICG